MHFPHLRLGDMNGLANHKTAMQQKHGDNRMKLEHGPLEPQAQRDLLERPALVHPVRHDLDYPERHGDRGAFEELGFARRVLGDQGCGDVEAREAGQTAQHEEGEEEVVEGGAQAEREGCRGGGDAEGDLGVLVSRAFNESLRKLQDFAKQKGMGTGRGGGKKPHTKSANESSSWPIRLAFFLQRATLPSMKSKNRPSGMKPSAQYRFV
jgi:hypothetical protein